MSVRLHPYKYLYLYLILSYLYKTYENENENENENEYKYDYKLSGLIKAIQVFVIPLRSIVRHKTVNLKHFINLINVFAQKKIANKSYANMA